MIPYDLIIPSASRPHLLEPTLRGLMARVDVLPQRVIVHDDAVFPGKQEEIGRVVADAVPSTVPTVVMCDDPPLAHGPSLHRLLSMVSTEYAMYSQDDHEPVRPIPVASALNLLHLYGLNQIRFNKRDTMDKKGREGEEFYKIVKRFFLYESGVVPLCVADHFYFQTNVFRVAALKPVVDWWATDGGAYGAFKEHMEVKINQVFNGEWRKAHPAFPPEVPVLIEGAWNDPEVRAVVQKTFIWGPVGEPAFVRHLGGHPRDAALIRGNRDPLRTG